MKRVFKVSAVAGLALAIGGCAQHYNPCCGYSDTYAVTSPATYQVVKTPRTCGGPACVNDVLVISVNGYGAPKSTFENLAQRRLMAMRASELDAYRKIAEQVSGLHIMGDTRVDDFVANRDRLRSYINSFVQGATITNQEFESDGMAITTMSLKISRSQMRRIMEEERRWHANGGHLPSGAAYHHTGFAPRY
ncbi:LPP20 family lipoprotein [Marinobacterium weihaiense]|uniref:LPP20 family lipoprotein n=1 Tax=Marinobacterium weihaiense TaxID=2851016 RepID=A0ABS6M892_9GAMM|nr:LPP20 family lipoprotein [Marinobacterium weihaiense]MBV0932493.1 LPP20 family lipoprotein [Marinobacterium weihaiense]